MKKRKFWGWGYEDYQVNPKTLVQLKGILQMLVGISQFESINPPELESISLRKARFHLPEKLTTFCASDKFDRLECTIDKCYA